MSTKTYSIIVAEDEELLLENLIRKIKQLPLPFKIVAASQTGIQALELVDEHRPDILITDIRMPVMNGLELIQKVHEFYPFIYSVIISGYSDFEYARKAITLNVSDYLLKPIDPDELLKTLSNILHKIQIKTNAYLEVFNADTLRNTPEKIAVILHNFIVENYKNEINLNLIAQYLNYSPSYLTKIFVQQYGCTPSKYIISLRMQTAQKLLIHEPSLSVHQIGELIGYPDQGYFSRIFKKQTGVGPLDFRNQYAGSTKEETAT